MKQTHSAIFFSSGGVLTTYDPRIFPLRERRTGHARSVLPQIADCAESALEFRELCRASLRRENMYSLALAELQLDRLRDGSSHQERSFAMLLATKTSILFG